MATSEPFEPRGRTSSMDLPPSVSESRLVLVGKTGAGKSSSGNTVLGRDAFRAAASSNSVTNQCCKQQEKVCGRLVTIVDTPGLFDTTMSKDTVKREISKCINMSAPGPHAILLVIKVGSFSAEEQGAVRQVEEIFGADAWNYTIVLFTHGDRVQSDFEQLLKESGPELQQLLNKVGHRYHVFNNLKANDRGQVLDLLETVDGVVAANQGRFYSNSTYIEVASMLDQREAELQEMYQKKLEVEIKAVESKYEKMLSEGRVIQERLKSEKEELLRYYSNLLSSARHVVECSAPTDSIRDVAFKFESELKLTSSGGASAASLTHQHLSLAC